MHLEELRKYKPQILALGMQKGVSNIRVFGSVAREEADDESDVDLLVTPLPHCGWGFFGFAAEVEDLIGHRVDIVSDQSLSGAMKNSILEDAQPL